MHQQRSKVQSRFRRSIVAILVAIGLAAGCEIILRHVFGLGQPVLIKPDNSQITGGFGYAVAPNQDTSRFFARNYVNNYSMRSDKFAAIKQDGERRVYFIGDSVTYGTTYIDQNKIFTTLVKKELNQTKFKPVEVLNASAGGWAVSNEVAFLRKNGIFGSDLLFVVINTADLTQPFADYQASINLPTQLPNTALHELWSRYVKPRLTLSAPPPADPGSLPEAPTTSTVQATSAVLSELDIARSFAQSEKAKFGIVYIPSRSKVWDSLEYTVSRQRLIDWCAARMVPLIDLTQDFAQKQLDEIYLDRGEGRIHLTPIAHQIVALRLSNDIQNQQLLESSNRP